VQSPAVKTSEMSKSNWLLIIQGDDNQPDTCNVYCPEILLSLLMQSSPLHTSQLPIMANLPSQGIYWWSLFADVGDEKTVSSPTGTSATHMRTLEEGSSSDSVMECGYLRFVAVPLCLYAELASPSLILEIVCLYLF